MVKDHGDDFTESTKKTVLRNFYVDDCLKSIPTVEDATKLTMDLKELLKRGGFNLTKWLSNKKKVLDAVPEDDQSKRLKDLALDTPVVERALGVFWNVDEDTFSYKMTNKCKPLTKRGLLSTLSSVYDPLGFASPYVLKARKIVQDLCRKKIGWDEEIPEEHKNEWATWIADLPNMANVVIPRCIKPANFGKVVSRQLHHFGDASEVAYGVTSYLRLENCKEKCIVCSSWPSHAWHQSRR